MKFMVQLILIFVVSSFISSTVRAQTPTISDKAGEQIASEKAQEESPNEQSKDKPKKRGKLAKELESLGLSPEKRDAIRQIQQQHRDSMQAKKQAVEAGEHALHEAMKKDAPEAELRQLFDKVQSQKQELAKARFEKILAIRGQLTAEQRLKYQKSQYGRHGKHGKGRHDKGNW